MNIEELQAARTLRDWYWRWAGWHLSRNKIDTAFGYCVVWQVGPYRSLKLRLAPPGDTQQ